MVVDLAGGEAGYDRGSLLGSLMTAAPMGELAADAMRTLRPGDARGPLLGGTLTQLAASLGTPHAFSPPPGYVLLLDEVGERPYRIDRMLTQLIGGGVLARAAAVVCGELPGCDEAGGGATAAGVVADLLDAFPGPVLFGFPTGHTSGPALTVPLGVEVRVAAGARPPAGGDGVGGPLNRGGARRPDLTRDEGAPDRNLRHGDGHPRRDAEGGGARRRGLRSAHLPPDERLPRGARHSVPRRLPRLARPGGRRPGGDRERGVARQPRGRGGARPGAPVPLAPGDGARDVALGPPVHRRRRHPRQDDDRVARGVAADRGRARIRASSSAA